MSAQGQFTINLGNLGRGERVTSTAGKARIARRLVALSTAVLVLGAGFGVAPAAAAHVACGDAIAVDTVLDSDVGPCATGLTITADSITLDLNGFTVFGTVASVEGPGITLDDVFGVEVTGGTVSDFDAGIFISGGFGNVVSGMEVRDNIGTGSTDFGDGIVIDSSNENVIRDNQVIHNGPFDGIGVIGGAASNGNVIENNLVADNNINLRPGFNTDIGIRLEPGTIGSIVQDNLVTNSGLDGIQVFSGSGGNVVRGNQANDNGELGVPSIRFGNGILVVGAGNLVEDNQADNNFASGVAVSGNANRLEGNSASGNAIAPLISGRTTFDLKDFRPDCGLNVWKANVFVTADPECTKRP